MNDKMETRIPSVFELTACESLKQCLREALRYLLDNLKSHEGFRRLPLPPPDETVLIIDLIIEYNYLRAYKASYAENLYNLIRYNNITNTQTQQVLPSLICLAILPYVKRKLDNYFEELNYKETRTADELTRVRAYRLFSRASTFVNLLFMLRYSTGGSSYHVIENMLMRTSLKGQMMESEDEDMTTGQKVSKKIADTCGKLLTLGSFMVQFLDYWNTHSNSTPLFSGSLEIPEPPKTDDLPYTDDRSSSICLICEHVRQNECALSNTGYVFCYSCIYRYVKSKHRCPITGNPATIDNIVKLFTTSAPS